MIVDADPADVIVDIHYPDAEIIRVVQDNLSPHCAGALYQAFPPKRRQPKIARWPGVVGALDRSDGGRRHGDACTGGEQVEVACCGATIKMMVYRVHRYMRQYVFPSRLMVWNGPVTDSIKVLKRGSLLATPQGREPFRESD
ncbi:hypothetical protein [Bradyrhizobium sp. 76]|uniref:hypothetical protein n=1 Tax=Bradyrhizobium sp. 76 TaxID=2782680 RepID=UPI001FFA448D|nr:hypothetical protein [Bradyrhizobium sp. 76]MCK1410027.1 hypothetical protein [Bradyrhizobium sp. 76]